MDKLISADKLSQALRDDLNIPGREFARVKRYIEEAEDELIRCKDCKRFEVCFPTPYIKKTHEHAFCSYGERREVN